MSVYHILDIYVAPHCFGCDTARNLARTLIALELPHLEVRLVDLSDPEVIIPPTVFATPTYVLDGRVISLGNPEEEWLVQLVASPAHSPGAAD